MYEETKKLIIVFSVTSLGQDVSWSVLSVGLSLCAEWIAPAGEGPATEGESPEQQSWGGSKFKFTLVARLWCALLCHSGGGQSRAAPRPRNSRSARMLPALLPLLFRSAPPAPLLLHL